MAKLTKGDSDIYHRALLVGLSGAGKSTLAALLAERFRLTWIDLENAKDVLVKLPEEYLDRINYIKLPDSASYPIAAQTLMQLFKYNKAEICVEHGKHQCNLCKKSGAPQDILDFTIPDPNHIVVVDGITQLAASILAYVCKDKPVDYKPERDDWGGLRKYSEFFCSQFQAFPGNLVCTAQAIESELEDGKVKLVPAFGSKDMSGKAAKAFSDIIYVEVKNKKHIAYCSSVANNSVQTKSRSDFLIENLAEPSLVPLFENKQGAVVELVKDGKEVKTEVQKLGTATVVQTPAQKSVSNLASMLKKS